MGNPWWGEYVGLFGFVALVWLATLASEAVGRARARAREDEAVEVERREWWSHGTE